LPKARFDHSEHSVSDCADCHSASSSSYSKDVLIPEISICQTCHGGEHATQSVPSTCITCHDFHLPQQGLIKTELDIKN
jgi:predicted CXXCH cytochrome family protein